MVAIYEDDPDAVPRADLRSAAGTVVDPGTKIPHDLVERTVPAGRYAIMRYIGPYSSMHAAYLWLYGQWLPSSGEEPRTIRSSRSTSPIRLPPRLSARLQTSSCRSCEISGPMLRADGLRTPKHPQPIG